MRLDNGFGASGAMLHLFTGGAGASIQVYCSKQVNNRGYEPPETALDT